MKTGILLLIIFLTAVITSSVFIAIYYFEIRKNIVNKSNCNAPLGSFAVNPGKTAVSTRRTVPVNGLQQASNLCLIDNNCKSFIYDENAKTMQIADLSSAKSNDNTKSLYTLQTGITT